MLKALTTVAVLVIIAATVADMSIVPVQGQQDHNEWIWNKTTIRVQNDLGDGHLLFLRCVTDSDGNISIGKELTFPLPGYISIFNGQYKEWSFPIPGIPLFCNFKWGQSFVGMTIYDADEDKSTCISKCWRSFRQDGLFYYDEYKDTWVQETYWGPAAPAAPPPL